MNAETQPANTPADPWTIGRLIQWTTDFLKKHGSDSARLDAEILLAHARGCERIQLYTAYEELAGDELRDEFRALVKRRSQGEPVAYLVGHKEFYSLPFVVNKDVLIPRPETEDLVLWALDKLKERKQASGETQQVCDVGTGSGAIAVAVAKHADVSITAVDVSAAAISVASTNAEKNGVADKIQFLESDLLAAVPTDIKFDLILSNPPYVTSAEYEELPIDIRNHEPKLALVGGEKGTAVITRLLEQAESRLKSGGWLIMEVSPMIAPEVKQLFEARSPWKNVQVLNDLSRQGRMVAAQFS